MANSRAKPDRYSARTRMIHLHGGRRCRFSNDWVRGDLTASYHLRQQGLTLDDAPQKLETRRTRKRNGGHGTLRNALSPLRLMALQLFCRAGGKWLKGDKAGERTGG